jgi:DNA-binding SARP family transcriptional activator
MEPEDDADPVDDLLALAEQGRGLAVIVLGDAPEADRRISFDGDEVLIEPPGLRLAPLGLSAGDAKQIDDLIDVAARVDDDDGGPVLPESDAAPNVEAPLPVAVTEMGKAHPESDVAVDSPSSEGTPEEDLQSSPEIEINVIGSVEVVGAVGVIDRRKSVELLAFLALHPGGVNDDILKCALWPDELPSASVFSTTVSLARSRLGLAADGTPHFPHLSNGRYRLGPSVTSDAARLEAAVRAARTQPPEKAIPMLTGAHELVRGLPFSGTKGGYEWTHDGTAARLEALAADAAHHLAELALDAGDPSLAQWAALQGLLASPGDEVLYRDRMLAADAAGNPAGVESVMEELCKVVDALEPYDSLHEETLALYERLSRRGRRTG